MLIAKIIGQTVAEVAEYTAMFPNTSFPSSGPNDEFMVENNCMFVNVWLPYDQNTEKLVSVAPYIQADDATHWVYTVQVEPLTPEEIAQREEAAKQSNKNQASTLLSATDWVELGDVANPSNPPWLTNKAEFTTYRSQLRAIAVNPPITVSEWPQKPVEIWSEE